LRGKKNIVCEGGLDLEEIVRALGDDVTRDADRESLFNERAKKEDQEDKRERNIRKERTRFEATLLKTWHKTGRVERLLDKSEKSTTKEEGRRRT